MSQRQYVDLIETSASNIDGGALASVKYPLKDKIQFGGHGVLQNNVGNMFSSV